MRFRHMTALYLLRGEEILLLYRVGSRVVPPSWCGIGGHFESDELNDPEACMLREFSEETGWDARDLIDLRLRYVSLRRVGSEVRQSHYFIAHLADPYRPLPACEEGTLRWTSWEVALRLPMPFSAIHCLTHYEKTGRHNQILYAGAADEHGVCYTALGESEPAMIP